MVRSIVEKFQHVQGSLYMVRYKLSKFEHVWGWVQGLPVCCGDTGWGGGNSHVTYD